MVFHAGELAVQARAGVRQAADRLSGMLEAPDLRGGIAHFLVDRTFAAMTARDREGRLWITPLTGEPGFLEVAGAAELQIHAAPRGPLQGLAAGQPVGLIVLELARRRRLRVNGTLVAVGGGDMDGGMDGDMTVQVDQAYGNCPQHIRSRALARSDAATVSPSVRTATALTEADVDLVRRADTFLLGTSHAERSADASHRGGPAGFVRVLDARTLTWPDFPGNAMFNSLGNLAVDSAAALLFVDFATGDTLHLSGTAEVVWGGAEDESGTDRAVAFTVESVVAGPAMPLRLSEASR
ncbi:pyridoxamine 5'-phosphate oxidase family protein [Pseudonocardia xishanensis]|uniref:Pyridoxamine 5'-phosphate oxidase family protein n=1 Tax=Pseudonocardia xishanensis TaxID=630995 RepID=A0ABP8RVV4_9PSEU